MDFTIWSYLENMFNLVAYLVSLNFSLFFFEI